MPGTARASSPTRRPRRSTSSTGSSTSRSGSSATTRTSAACTSATRAPPCCRPTASRRRRSPTTTRRRCACRRRCSSGASAAARSARGDPEVLARLFSGIVSAYQALDPAVMSDDPAAEERLPLAELHEVVAAAFAAPGSRCAGGERAPPVTRQTPPEGDWLGTQFLRFERHGPLAHVVVDRPEARNALTPAMYFGIRYAVDHVEPRRRAGRSADHRHRRRVHARRRPRRRQRGRLGRPPDAARHGQHAVRRGAPVGEAGRHRGQRAGAGRRADDRLLCDVAVASDRATFRAPELLRGIGDTNYAPGAAPPDRPGPRPGHADDRAGRHRGGGGGVGARGPGGAARAAARRGGRRARGVLPHRARRPAST